VISSFVPLVDLVFNVLAFLDFPSSEHHFWPFTGVLGRIWRFVTRKVGFAASNRSGVERSNHGLLGCHGLESAGCQLGCFGCQPKPTCPSENVRGRCASTAKREPPFLKKTKAISRRAGDAWRLLRSATFVVVVF
jgi:hypothetical protein